jgi:hypothetical protein
MSKQNGPVETPAARIAAGLDRRGAERYPSDVQPSWRMLGGQTGESRVGKVHNISTTGISLMLKHWIKPGKVLVVRLQSREGNLSRPLPVRVMHATAQVDGDWLVGCMFVRTLSGEELQMLVSDPV